MKTKMIKAVLYLILLSLFTTLLIGCNNEDASALIEWSFDDEILDWNDVPSAKYYEIILFEDDRVTPIDHLDYNLYAYDSHYSFYPFQNGDYNVKIIIYDESGEEHVSDMIEISLDRDSQHVQSIGMNYQNDLVSWTDLALNNPSFVNYTVKINDETFDTEENAYHFENHDLKICEIRVRANYTDGSSLYSEPFYAYGTDLVEMKTATHELSSNAPFTYDFDTDETIIAVVGNYNFQSIHVLPREIAKIEGNTLELNRYYLEREGNSEETDSLMILIRFTVITREKVYVFTLLNE